MLTFPIFRVRPGLVAAVAALSLPLAPTRAQTLAADYQLQNTFNSSAGTIGPLTPVGPAVGANFTTQTVMGQSQRVLTLGNDPNGMVAAAGTGVQTQTNPFLSSTNFSIVLLASFSLNPNLVATKVFDFKNLSSDDGLYINDTTGLLSFNGVTTGTVPGGTAIPANTFAQIVLTRDGTTGLTTVYANGAQAIQFTDTNNQAVLGDATATGNSFLTVFRDDGTGVGSTLVAESTTGSLARLRLLNGPLSAAQVTALDTIAPIPEPATWTLVLGAVVLTLVATRRHRLGHHHRA